VEVAERVVGTVHAIFIGPVENQIAVILNYQLAAPRVDIGVRSPSDCATLIQDKISVILDFEAVAGVTSSATGPKRFSVFVVENKVAIGLHDQTSSLLLVGDSFIGQKAVAAGKCSVTQIDGRGRSRGHNIGRNVANNRF